jgi:catechol 2,3-dioxygenase-like lactoylglutathione lyase family enzyme
MKAEISVMFNVKNVDRSVKFYEALGFDVRWAWKGEDGKLDYAGVGIGGAVIALGRIWKGEGTGSGYRDYQGWVKGTLGGGVIVNVELRDVDKIYARAKKAKAKVESKLREWPYGKAFTINDPDGYVVKFLPKESSPRRQVLAPSGQGDLRNPSGPNSPKTSSRSRSRFRPGRQTAP